MQHYIHITQTCVGVLGALKNFEPKSQIFFNFL